MSQNEQLSESSPKQQFELEKISSEESKNDNSGIIGAGTGKEGGGDNCSVISPDWSMFEKVCVLGEGAYGTVYKVKSLKTSILSGNQDGGRVELNALTSNMKLKIRQQKLGVNMHSSV